jgi:hypothetical protein
VAIEFIEDIELEHHQRAELADTCNTPGFKTVQKIFDAEVQKFFVALMNLPSGSDQVIEGHRVAKVAAQLWEGAAQRINAEVGQYAEAIRANKPQTPVDITDGNIDLGPAQTTRESFEEGADLEY